MFASFFDTVLPTLRSSSLIQGPASQSRPNIQFMDMGITWIRYCLSGDSGPTIVLNTDPPLTIESYDQTIAELSRHFRVVVFEIPGFGFSFPKRLDFKYDFDSITVILVEFLQRLNLGPYILSLPCLLGFCGIKIANLHPELISHMVLNQIPTWQGALEWKKGRDPLGVLGKPVLGQIALHFLKRKRSKPWFDLVIGEAKMAEKLAQTALWSYDLGACFSLASCFQFYLKGEQPELEPVKQPSLIIWGECDGSHQKTDKSLTRQLTLDFEEVYIQKAGHSPEVEAPEIFAASVPKLMG